MCFEAGRIRFRNADAEVCDEPVAGEETLCSDCADKTSGTRYEGGGSPDGPCDQVWADTCRFAELRATGRQTAAPKLDTSAPKCENGFVENRQKPESTGH